LTALPASNSSVVALTRELGDITIVQADEALVVVCKPAGLLSVPGRGPDRADCVAARVQALFPDALIVHRLDMSTSGLMVFGRGLSAQRALGRAFETRQVSKHYVAVVAGHLAEEQGSVALPLICDWPNRPRQKVDWELGKPALTHWRVIERTPTGPTCRVELQPITGRSHQLRVHLSTLGHPILGDELYAPPSVVALAPRLLLHASRLGLAHPSNGEWLQFEDPPPF
jgi:tRNA pseudouridine32 synthase/23S rRNA pseudouridine746 synthase